MIIACSSKVFEAIAQGHCTADYLPGSRLRIEPGDRITYHDQDSLSPTLRHVSVIVTYADCRPDGTLLSFQLVSPQLSVATPGGCITIKTDLGEPASDSEDYPGCLIGINKLLAAAVEWHPELRTFVLRTYAHTQELDTPLHYHRWDTGADLEP